MKVAGCVLCLMHSRVGDSKPKPLAVGELNARKTQRSMPSQHTSLELCKLH